MRWQPLCGGMGTPNSRKSYHTLLFQLFQNLPVIHNRKVYVITLHNQRAAVEPMKRDGYLGQDLHAHLQSPIWVLWGFTRARQPDIGLPLPKMRGRSFGTSSIAAPFRRVKAAYFGLHPTGIGHFDWSTFLRPFSSSRVIISIYLNYSHKDNAKKKYIKQK